MRLTKNNTNLITLLNQIRKLYLNLKRKHDKNESNLAFLQYTITRRYSKDRKKQLMRNFMETILVVSIGLVLSHFVRFRTMELSVVTSKLVKKFKWRRKVTFFGRDYNFTGSLCTKIHSERA